MKRHLLHTSHRTHTARPSTRSGARSWHVPLLAVMLMALCVALVLPARADAGALTPALREEQASGMQPNLARLLFDALGPTSSADDAPDDAQQGAGESPAASDAAQSWTETREQTIELPDPQDPQNPDAKLTYTVRVTFTEQSGVPQDARLEVALIDATPERLDSLRALLELGERDYLPVAVPLSVALVADGAPVQPAAPVAVELETNTIDPAWSDAVELVPLAASKEEAQAAPMTNLTGNLEDEREGIAERDLPERPDPTSTRVRTATAKLGELMLAVVARPVSTWTFNGTTVDVLAGRSLQVTPYELQRNDELAPGLSLLELFGLHTEPAHAWVPTLWLAATCDASAPATGGLLVCAVQDGSLTQVLAGREGTSQPVPIAADGTFALLWEEDVAAAAKAASLASAQAEGDTYTVTWVDDDGTVLETDENVAEGSTPSYDGETPTKAATAQYTYTFDKWDPEPEAVTEDTTYTATYTATVNKYTVTWKDADGTVLETDEEVEYGTLPTYNGGKPTKEADEQYTYTFEGWSPEIAEVAGDVTYTAVYQTTTKTYKITWLNDDNTLLKTETYEYGDLPDYGLTPPTKTETSGAVYNFASWDPAVARVIGDATYKATYTAAPFQLCIQDSFSKDPISGATFELKNNATGTVVWRGTTGVDGLLLIEETAPEEAESQIADGALGGKAAFKVDSTYTLKQTNTDDKHFSAEGSWTLKVTSTSSGSRQFSLERVATAGDLKTIKPEGPYGIRFYLYNRRKSTVTYDYNYPVGVGSSQPENVTKDIDGLAYDLPYTVDVDNPDLAEYGYEFAGWSVDGSATTVKQGETTVIDTVNIPAHTMTACWRIPLTVQAKTYAGDSSTATLVVNSKGTYAVDAERNLTFSSLEDFGVAYGAASNEPVKTAMSTLVARQDLDFAYATITSGATTRNIASVRYNLATHSWQYRMAEGATTWIDIKHDDLLTLLYVSTTVNVRWVVEDNDGSLTLLRDATTTVTVGSEWKSTNGTGGLLSADDTPIVEKSYYYRSLGFGPLGADSINDLDASGLASFSLKNSNEGFHLRTSASNDRLASGNTIYVVYSETPPTGYAQLNIENYTDDAYTMDNLYCGGSERIHDQLKQGTAILVKANGELSVLKKADAVAANTTARIVLLGAGTKQFTLSGGFANTATDAVISAAVTNSSQVVRTTLTSAQVRSTKDVSKGTLEGASGTVIISFDSNLRDVVLRKDWSADAYPEHFRVDLNLYEGRVASGDDDDTTDTTKRLCNTAGGTNGVYTLGPSSTAANNWQLTVRNLPVRLAYTVSEKAIRRVQNGTTDVTADFTSSYDYDTENLIVVYNERSNDVCQVGNVTFKTIKAAVAYLEGNNMKTATIEMLRDYVMAESASVTIPSDYKVTLTTASGISKATVTRGFSGATDFIKVASGATLTLADVTLAGKLDNTTFEKDGNGGLINVTGGTLVAGEGASLINARAANGSAIYVSDGGTVTLNGAYVSGNRATTGGAIGVGDASCTVYLAGDTYVYNNYEGTGGGQRNVYLNQDSNKVISVLAAGMGENARVGVYVPDGDSAKTQYVAHGQPAAPFATYDGSTDHLDTLINDRLGSGEAKKGYASTVASMGNTVVWGPTFSFAVTVQWLDAEFVKQPSAPTGANVVLSLTGGYLTPASGVQRTATPTDTGWTCTFDGLARYDGNGNLCEYKLDETTLAPSDYKRVVFDGDKGVKDHPLTYDAMATAESPQTVIVSNYYRYATVTVEKVVVDASGRATPQQLDATFAVYGVPKDDADLTDGNVRYGGVGGVHDLPIGLRTTGVSSTRFYTTEGGNRWVININPAGSVGTLTFHRFYDAKFGEFVASGSGYALSSGIWEPGDVILAYNSPMDTTGDCKVYDGSAWHTIATGFAVKYLSFNRQDGNGGVESVGGLSMGKSHTIENVAPSSTTTDNPYTFSIDDHHLLSDYYYYVVETSVHEDNNKGRTISGTHKLVAVYNPTYAYDQNAAKVTVTNTYRDYLSVDKLWPEDVTNPGDCLFEVYEMTSNTTNLDLSNTDLFKKLVVGNAKVGEEGLISGVAGVTFTKVGEFSLPEKDTNSWVHVVTADDFDDEHRDSFDRNKSYMVWEKSAGGIAISNPNVSVINASTDAVYSYDKPVDQITVQNMSDILCKVVDSDGTEHPFRTLNDALQYGRTRTNGDSKTEFTIEMLRDYNIPASDVMTINSGEKITLTTATDGITRGTDYVYKNKDDNTKTRATITRQTGNSYPFVRVTGDASDVSATGFTLENLELNGSDIAINYRVGNTYYYNGSFVCAANATVVVQRQVADNLATSVYLHNAKASNGGAIYAEKSDVDVSDALFKGCASTNTENNNLRGGGAIWCNGTRTTAVRTRFTGCTAGRCGGAINAVSDVTGGVLKLEDCVFASCTAKSNGGAVNASDSAEDTIATIVRCDFTECVADSNGGNGGGVHACSMTLDVRDSTFTTCTGWNRGGGIHHDTLNEGSVATFENCAFTSCATKGGGDDKNARCGGAGISANSDKLVVRACTFDSCDAWIRGGGVLHFNLDAASTVIDDCEFKSCTTQRSGGGAMCLTGLTQSVTACTAIDCSALVSSGGGLDIASFDVNKEVTVRDCAFVRCVAGGGKGGGICAGGRALTVEDTVFDACSATSQYGGAISMSEGGSMEELNLNGCTVKECSSRNDGGALYYSSKNESVNSSVVVRNSQFDTCTTTTGAGGAMRVNSTTTLLSNSSFVRCQARGNGGVAANWVNGNYVDASSFEVRQCTFDTCEAGVGNTGNNGGGGAIYTNAQTLVVDGVDGKSAFADCKARGGGGAIFQERNTENSSTTLAKCSFANCATSNSSGGVLLTYATTLSVDNSSFDNCTSNYSGGAIWHVANDSYVSLSHATLTSCSFSGVHAGYGRTDTNGEGGALYTNALVLSIGEVGTRTTFDNCTARSNGGVIRHTRQAEGSAVRLIGCDFTDCASIGGGGGTLFTGATVMNLDDVTFDTSTSMGTGGAVYQDVNNSFRSMSAATVKGCSFAHTEAGKGSTGNNGGGALYTSARTLSLGGVRAPTTFEDCKARGKGGAVWHDRSNCDGTAVTLARCSFDACESGYEAGGALHTIAAALRVDDSTFANCHAKGDGGAVCHSINGNYRAESLAQVMGTSFANTAAGVGNTGSNGAGGAIWSNALTLEMGASGRAVTLANCEARGNGGAICHSCNTETSATTLSHCTLGTCTSTNAGGGALYSIATTLVLDESDFDTCASKKDAGGAVYHNINNGNYVSISSTTVTKCTFAHTEAGSDTSDNSGGALYTNALALSITGEAGKTTFLDTTSRNGGGAVRHERNATGATTTLATCSFNTCESKNHEGGALFSRAYVVTATDVTFANCVAQSSGGCVFLNTNTNTPGTATFTRCAFVGGTSKSDNGGGLYSYRSTILLVDTTIRDCVANYGGGLYQRNTNNLSVTLDGCSVTGNTARIQGGGVCYNDDNDLVLRNGTSITGNRLDVTTVDNGAGLYMDHNRTKARLVLGTEGVVSDTITVYDNLTSAGEQSNAHINRSGTRDSKTQRLLNRNTSVLLLSSLVKSAVGSEGSIGVCDPGAENTKFGVEDVAGHTGMEYIVSDIDTLRGKLDPADRDHLTIIWYAPPVCKITDQNGMILTYDDGKTAAFSSLKEAFDVVNNLTAGYLKDYKGVEPQQIQIQMLVSDYVQNEKLPVLQRSITLSTATAGPDDYDYPLSATAEYGTVTRGPKASGSLITVASGVELEVRGITLDGGSSGGTPLAANANGGLIYARADAVVRLSADSVLQNSAAGEGYNGGAVYVTGSSDPAQPSLVMDKNAAIVGCSASNGGGVYLTPNATLTMNDAARLEGNETSVAGGAVYVSPRATVRMLDNPHVIVRDNHLTDPSGYGAGFYLGSNESKLYLRLGASADFSHNYVDNSDSSTRTNGSENYPQLMQDIYLGEAADPTESLVLTGNLVADEGSLWVWAEYANHYEGDRQFAVIEDGVYLSPSTLAAFRNARDDDTTGNITGHYYTGVTGENASHVYWGSSAMVEVAFVKIDGHGAALSGVEFSLYPDVSCTPGTEVAKAVSGELEGDGVGVVRFGKVPQRAYFMRETSAAPEGMAQNDHTYLVLVGAGYLDLARLRALPEYGTYFPAGMSNVATQADLDAQNLAQMGQNGQEKNYAVLPLKDDGAGLVARPVNVARYGLLNESARTRKVMLRKVNGQYQGLAGAEFTLYNADWSVREEGLASVEGGMLMVADLPEGTYYLQETKAPEGYASNTGRYYQLEVTADDAIATATRTDPHTDRIALTSNA